MGTNKRFVAKNGLDNKNNSITNIGVNGATFTQAGAFSLTLTATANTNVTFPTTGTLATLTGSEALTGKTYNGLTVTTSTGTLKIANGSTLATSGAFSTTLTATATTAVTLPTSGTLVGSADTGTVTNTMLAGSIALTKLTSDTTTALGVGTLELGNASDTTLSRSAAGVLAVEGVVIPSISSTNTLTNKRVTPRLTSTSSATGTVSISTDGCDNYDITSTSGTITIAQAASQSPTNGQKLLIRVYPSNTAHTISWGTDFIDGGVTRPTTITTANKWIHIGFIYNSNHSTGAKWMCVASATEA